VLVVVIGRGRGDDCAAAVRGRGIRHRFGDTVAVDGVDLEVAAGVVFRLMGLNGAGRTTIRMITTLLPPPARTIEVFGKGLARHKLDAWQLIGYVLRTLFSANSSRSAAINLTKSPTSAIASTTIFTPPPKPVYEGYSADCVEL
jgi:ABC-type molybdenum transport system ATPase subunit/photorepair protein PhrA